MLFNVKYSKEKDIWNHLNSNWKFSFLKHGRTDIQERLLKPYPESYKKALKKAKTKTTAETAIKDFLSSLPKSFHNTTPLIARGAEQLLNNNEKEIINKLENVYQEKFPFKKIKVYLTTANICPYSYTRRWYMTGRNSSEEGHVKTALHELNHFMFYYYYPELENELGKEKYEFLKEALAIYTNPEGNNKPTIKKLESYFAKHLDKTIPEVLSLGEWKNLANKY